MKDGLKHIVGKRIAAVAVAVSNRAPRHQVFLIFPDGSSFELFGENFTCCAGLDKADGLERYVRSGGGKIVQFHGEPVPTMSREMLTTGGERPPYHVPAPETLADKMQRDLDAWLEAKAAIARARRS